VVKFWGKFYNGSFCLDIMKNIERFAVGESKDLITLLKNDFPDNFVEWKNDVETSHSFVHVGYDNGDCEPKRVYFSASKEEVIFNIPLGVPVSVETDGTCFVFKGNHYIINFFS